jgi:type IV secretory pathway TrbL component
MTAGATAIVLITIEFVDKAALPKRNEFIGALVLVCWVLGGCLTAIAIVLWAWGARTWWTMTKLIRR